MYKAPQPQVGRSKAAARGFQRARKIMYVADSEESSRETHLKKSVQKPQHIPRTTPEPLRRPSRRLGRNITQSSRCAAATAVRGSHIIACIEIRKGLKKIT
eukprot:TRINITY_DN2963_c1_g2_i2.p1 TRINITY_DN2963_c1_g2~~TRINITY_DN2963_c1_g2_i2.p1  ORF type:complete len:101 (+),score=0.16 TRINITY_DN2963_c1_g2_i2:195-497(+)